jgi:hypothetical protein
VIPLTQVAVSTIVGTALAYVVALAYARTGMQFTMVDSLLIAATVGLSILIWREVGNTATLNDDPIPVVSPNDVLGPVLTYVSLGLLAAFRSSIAGAEWQRLAGTAHAAVARGEHRDERARPVTHVPSSGGFTRANMRSRSRS